MILGVLALRSFNEGGMIIYLALKLLSGSSGSPLRKHVKGATLLQAGFTACLCRQSTRVAAFYLEQKTPTHFSLLVPSVRD